MDHFLVGVVLMNLRLRLSHFSSVWTSPIFNCTPVGVEGRSSSRLKAKSKHRRSGALPISCDWLKVV